jgi:hypothetical protein
MQTRLTVRTATPASAIASALGPLVQGISRVALGLLLVLSINACERKGAELDQSQYQSALVGDWQGSVGGDNESITFHADGRFSSEVLPTGFISTTLDQGVTDTVSGTWMLQGKVINLGIEQASGAQPVDLATSSTIVSFNQNQLVIKSDSGQTSTFIRAM